MALTEVQQLQKLLEQSKHVLILFGAKENGDATAAALALKHFLEKQDKLADIVCSDFSAPKTLQFLPAINSIKSILTNIQKFIIKVDVSKAPIESLSYDIDGHTLSIHLTPTHGLLSKNELRTAQSTFKYDLIITLNTADLNALGPVFHNNTDLFYRTGIVAIDHSPTNERYGHVNIVDLTATSTSEIIYKIIKELGGEHMNTAIATAILTGMTVATRSFKNANITPATMQIASSLMGHGAEREKIVQHLYRNRSIAGLKLWGEALAHLQSDAGSHLVWTTITRETFTRSGGTPDDLHGIIEELIGNTPEAKVIFMLYEIDHGIGGLLACEKNYNALQLAQPFSPTGSKHLANFTLTDITLSNAENKVKNTLLEKLADQN